MPTTYRHGPTPAQRAAMALLWIGVLAASALAVWYVYAVAPW